MPSTLIIDKIKGINRKASPTDLDKSFLQELKNLSLTKKPGALVKDSFYNDISDTLVGTLPASVTLKSLFELGLTSPSNQDIYLLHVTDAGNNNRLYVGPYWNGSSFISSWLELTEHEGEYTAGASTGHSTLVVNSGDSDFSKLNDNSDYYNDFVLTIDITATVKISAVVIDYTVVAGVTKTFDFKTDAIRAAASGDKFSLARSVLFSDGISAASSGTPPRYADFPQVDDVIRFLKRENAALGMTGNTNQFPGQYQLLYSYVNNSWFSDFWLDMEQLSKPYVAAPAGNRDGILLVAAAGGGSVTAGVWNFYAAYEYDGHSIGELSDALAFTVVGGSQTLTIQIQLPVTGSTTSGNFLSAFDFNESLPTYFSPYLLNRRITGVRLYGKKPGDTDEVFIISSNLDSSTLNANGVIIKVAVVFTSDPAGNTHAQDIGQTNLKPNFKYGAAISTHFIAAAIRTSTGDRKNNFLAASIVDGEGLSAIDTFGGTNLINLGFFGSKEITGINVLGDEGVDQSPKARALIFTDDDYYILDIVSGASFNHRLDNIGHKEGLFAPDGLLAAEGLLFGVSRNGFRIYTIQGTKIIGEEIKTDDDFDGLTDPSEAIAAYHKKERYVIFHFKTDSKTYLFDLLTKDFKVFEFDYADDFNWFAPQRDGGLLAITDSKILDIGEGSDQDGTKIVPTIKTIRLNPLHFNPPGKPGDSIRLLRLYTRYKSDTAKTINVYLDGSASAMTLNNVSFPVQTIEDEVKVGFPVGTLCKEFEIEILLDATQKSTNTDFEWNRLQIDAEIEGRLL